MEAASRRLFESEEQERVQTLATFFDPDAPITITEANLPHWKQDGVTYFVTFRMVDSLPQERIQQWMADRDHWLAAHPEPLSEQVKMEYHTRFSAILEDWLDQGSGSNALALDECHTIVANALRHFEGQRYKLGEFVVASNHVHVIVTPLPGNDLSDILHSWKSFTAKEVIKVDAASRRLQPWWDKLHERRLATAAKENPSKYPAITFQRPVWQKESFDHIVRSPASLAKFEQYIRNHGGGGSGVPPLILPLAMIADVFLKLLQRSGRPDNMVEGLLLPDRALECDG